MTIENQEDLRSATIFLNADVLKICNDTCKEDMLQHFNEAKDFLIAIYKYNSKRVKDKK